MSKSNQFETDVLALIFNGTSIPGLADNTSSGPLASLYLALHSADPGEAGNQSTSEVTYTGYQRVAIARTAGGWTVTAGSVSPTSTIEFGECTAGSGTATFGSIGTAQSGTGKILYRGALSPTIPFQVGTVPRIRNTSTITED